MMHESPVSLGLCRHPVTILAIALVWMSSPQVAAAYQGGKVSGGGVITGIVTFAGTPPMPKAIVVTKDKQVCGNAPIYSQDLRVGKNGGIRNVVVRLTDIDRGKPPDHAAVTLTQKGCGFHPHVLIAPSGGEVTVVNADPITHNIHTFSFDNPQLNQAQPAGAPALRFKPSVPETIKVQCDIHKWMGGWIVVAEHPYYTVTDAKGRFTLSDVPAGTYTLEFWQESLGVATKSVTVKAGATLHVAVSMRHE